MPDHIAYIENKEGQHDAARADLIGEHREKLEGADCGVVVHFHSLPADRAHIVIRNHVVLLFESFDRLALCVLETFGLNCVCLIFLRTQQNLERLSLWFLLTHCMVLVKMNNAPSCSDLKPARYSR